MNKAVALPALLLLTAGLAAQSDRIVWTDGSVTDKIRVTDFTWKEVTYSERGSTETRSADMVASLDVSKVRDTFKRAFAAGTDDERYSQFRLQIDKINDRTFEVQFGYLAAARLLMKNGETNEAFALLEKLQKDHPKSGFLPDVFRIKLDHYMGLGADGARNAKTVAKQFRDTAVGEAWPDGFVAEADYFSILAKSLGGEVEGKALQKELEGLIGRTRDRFPNVADRAMVQLGTVQRQLNDMDGARENFEKVLDKDGIDAGTRAQALIGLGHVQMAAGDPSNKEPYRAALMAFLRVYVMPEASPGQKAEALYSGSQAAEKWGGPDSSAMARRLRGYLRRDFADSPWAKK